MANISVIIPIYNVEKYLDRCIQSVVNQTYSNIEIICICGDSLDNSDKVCQQWKEKDSRIIILKQDGGRLGSARNQGIRAASADLIAFIDADDWWDITMLEKLYNQYIATKAEMIMCNRYNVYFDEYGNEIHRKLLRELSMTDRAVSVEENPNLLYQIEVSVNGKLYEKQLFVDNNIWQPDIFGEDRAIMHYLIAKCHSIGKVDEGLYFYHAEREGNSVGNIKTYETAAECMEYIHNLFVSDGIEKKFFYQLNWIFKMFVDLVERELGKYNGIQEKKLAEEVREKMDVFMKKYYPEKYRKKYIWGSYNLRRIVEYVYPQKNDTRYHFAYSSIISAMSEKSADFSMREIENKNQKDWLCADCNNEFLNKFYPSEGDLFFIDFLEERFPVIEMQEGNATYSPLFQENVYCNEVKRIIEVENRTELWKEKCLEFIKIIRKRIPADNVYLIKSLLTTHYGNMTCKQEFSNIEEIRKINRILETYYDFFVEHFDGIHVIENKEDVYFYTEEKFIYGCFPWHVNEHYYTKYGQHILQQKMNEG